MSKFIFVTGGVVSSVGKGLTAASLGALLEEYGYSVRLQKFDPYLNVDPGTMSPYQHGEVYVLDDGAECDLDFGHYERFTSTPLSRRNSLTAGQVYETLINRERKGEFLGQTVQVIPHVTNVIKERLHEGAQGCDILITEIGGTVGDIEGMPFYEAARQLALEEPRGDVCFLHVSLIPYVTAAGEQKSKPTQQSVAKLREIGIMPDALICRVEQPIQEGVKQKLSLFCNVPLNAVIEEIDVQDSIYEVPLMLRKEGLDEIVLKRLGLPSAHPQKSHWEEIVRRIKTPKNKIRVAVVGKYMEVQDAYKSVFEALHHAAIAHDARLDLFKIDAEMVEVKGAAALLNDMDAILVPGGFGNRGIDGKILAAQYARENNVPYLGLCLGLQIAAIEFARNVLNLKKANSTEFDEKTPDPVVLQMTEQKNILNKGATMRLGVYRCELKEGSKAAKAYGVKEIRERHRHRFEFNSPVYAEAFEKNGMMIAGKNPERGLVEILELKDHPYFVGVQFHPEFLSKPTAAHPLFSGLIGAGLKKHNEGKTHHPIPIVFQKEPSLR
jgi:CTP synthase